MCLNETSVPTSVSNQTQNVALWRWKKMYKDSDEPALWGQMTLCDILKQERERDGWRFNLTWRVLYDKCVNQNLLLRYENKVLRTSYVMRGRN